MLGEVGSQRASRLGTQETKKRPHERDVFLWMRLLPLELSLTPAQISLLYQSVAKKSIIEVGYPQTKLSKLHLRGGKLLKNAPLALRKACNRHLACPLPPANSPLSFGGGSASASGRRIPRLACEGTNQAPEARLMPWFVS